MGGKHKLWENSDAQRGEKYCTVRKLRHVLGKAVKECATVTKEGWRGVQSGHKKNTFFRENSRLGLQSYTDTSGEEWWRAGEERRREERKSEEGETIKRHFKPLSNGCFTLIWSLLIGASSPAEHINMRRRAGQHLVCSPKHSMTLCVYRWSRTLGKTLQWPGTLAAFICEQVEGNINSGEIMSEDIEQFHSVKSPRLFSSSVSSSS